LEGTTTAGVDVVAGLTPFKLFHQRLHAPVLHLAVRENPPMCTLQPENTARNFEGASSISIYQSQSPQQRRRLSMAKIETTQIRRTIRRQQLRKMVPMADSTIYEMEQRGEFPRRFALSPRCIVWDLAEVEAWLMDGTAGCSDTSGTKPRRHQA
jgi:predicted DNA-binding transcriptional regulator AlpA